MSSGRCAPRAERKVGDRPQVGAVNGLAVHGPNLAALLEIEVATLPVPAGQGKITVTGIIEEEELGGGGRTLRRKSLAIGSVQNVITVLRNNTAIDPRDYDIHMNFPGGVPVDGPSAGAAIATAIYSSLTHTPVHHRVAITGEVSIRGNVRSVGGIVPKVGAAKQAGATRVIIPVENWQEMFRTIDDLEITPVGHILEVFGQALLPGEVEMSADPPAPLASLLAAGETLRAK